MSQDPNTAEPGTNPDAAEDPITETPQGTDPEGMPADNPSGSNEGANEDQGDDIASGGS